MCRVIGERFGPVLVVPGHNRRNGSLLESWKATELYPLRTRHRVSLRLCHLLWPLLRFSTTRQAYVLRVVGDRHGPVLVPRRR